MTAAAREGWARQALPFHAQSQSLPSAWGAPRIGCNVDIPHNYDFTARDKRANLTIVGGKSDGMVPPHI